MTQFCPISLSNVIYKIVLKVLAKRHKKSSIPDYFRKSKCLGSSYSIVRLIIANILLAFESCIIWSYKHKRTRNTFMVVKLDMNIFYDRVEWVLPRAIIKKRFHVDFVNMILECESCIIYSIFLSLSAPADHPSSSSSFSSFLVVYN